MNSVVYSKMFEYEESRSFFKNMLDMFLSSALDDSLNKFAFKPKMD